MAITQTLKAPLFAEWTKQYVKVPVAGLQVGQPVTLTVDGTPTDFQYTGKQSEAGAEIMLMLGFGKNQSHDLKFTPSGKSETSLQRKNISLRDGARVGAPGCEIVLPPLTALLEGAGPFAGFAGFPLQSRICCEHQLESCELTQTDDGPMFDDYVLDYRYSGNHFYTLSFRCYRQSSFVEVSEEFQLGMNSEVRIVFNPMRCFDSILSRDNFEGETQPEIEALGQERPNDLLCRLQMPVLTEYFIPNNRGWFAFFDSNGEEQGMIGVLGLYGSRWKHPVDNMPQVFDDAGRAEWRASLGAGTRYWLLYHGAVEKKFTPEHRHVFHRLRAEFNELRLDEHLDLTGTTIYDSSCWKQPGFWIENFREQVLRNVQELPSLRSLLDADGNLPQDNPSSLLWRSLLHGTAQDHRELYQRIVHRFEKWVRDFQGYRLGKHDYEKNVIGFSRRLRTLMLEYELLRKDGFINEEQVKQLGSYFAFAARRILDEGKWPHSRTWLHPDHPESVRDLYHYPGEHRPDKLVWTNSLPNFQSDQTCALLHLSTLVPEHPDAQTWQRFALDDIERNLDAYCSPSGAWEESIGYALYTFAYFAITFRILKNRTGINYFEDERMRRFAGWLTRFFGLYDKRFKTHTFPGVGNSVLPQNGSAYILAYAGELNEDDPLRHDLIALYQKTEDAFGESLTYGKDDLSPLLLAAMAPIPDREYPLRPLGSEHMQDLGVSLRHDHPSPTESYLFQKIGFWKDHYENDESSFNWYAKGTPLVMDYGTYTSDVAGADAHNLVEIPDMDSLQRGYLADSYFSAALDYTRSEVPVTLKLLHGRLRSFAEIDGPPEAAQFFYIGDENPSGPKVWKTRLLLFVKPDYVVLFDRVFGPVPHRFNLHVTADELKREGNHIHARGRFDLDLHCFVQQPQEFEFQSGELVPGPDRFGEGAANPHRQQYFRLYNEDGNSYRTLLFAKEREREVTIEKVGESGIQVTTPEYCDYVFLSDEAVRENTTQVRFTGRAGWIRREANGTVRACVADGDAIEAFGVRLEGRGPWSYNMDGTKTVETKGVPRKVQVSHC